MDLNKNINYKYNIIIPFTMNDKKMDNVKKNRIIKKSIESSLSYIPLGSIISDLYTDYYGPIDLFLNKSIDIYVETDKGDIIRIGNLNEKKTIVHLMPNILKEKLKIKNNGVYNELISDITDCLKGNFDKIQIHYK